jgi:hypothetical protein
VTSPATFCRATCLCSLTRPPAHRAEVPVLQHPQEQQQAKNSVALLRLSQAHGEVIVDERCVGERLAPETLLALLLTQVDHLCPSAGARPWRSRYPGSMGRQGHCRSRLEGHQLTARA